MFTDVLVPTGMVVTVKVAVVAFAAIVTLTGTVASAALLLDSLTTAPPTGAGPVSVTVPVDATPPRTEVGFNERLFSVGTVTVKPAVLVIPR